VLKPWLQTYSGGQFFPTEPRAEDIRIGDIAHALAHQCRFSGHGDQFYSVAQHSVLTSSICDPKHALALLLHDAAEAYCVDLPTPIKHLPELQFYRQIERAIQLVIGDKYGIDWSDHAAAIREADGVALATEMRDLMKDPPQTWGLLHKPATWRIASGWEPLKAKEKFLARFNELF